MDNYDPDYITLRAPLVLVNVPGDKAFHSTLTKNFDQYNLDGLSWDNSILKNRLLLNKYLIKVVDSTPSLVVDKIKSLSESEKHSKLSPFNVLSDLFPNGILSVNWLKKYQKWKPFVFIQVYEYNEEIDDDKVVAEIALAKDSLDKVGIKLTVIILSSSHSSDETRINKIRQQTNLNLLTGLLYVNTNSLGYEKNAELLVNGLFSNLKAPAVEFYKKIESNIKQRHKKYYSVPSSNNIDTSIELTPKFLETRNLIKLGIISQFTYPHNLEGCIHFFETSYKNLIELVHQNFFEFTKDRISDHDAAIYRQIRYLLDVISFHLVRAYLSIEEPISALKSHTNHVLSVVSATRGKIDSSQWVSCQYEWLGDLLQLVPRSILTDANIRAYNKSHRNGKVLKFWGGVRFANEKVDMLLDPGLVFLKCLSYVVLASSTSELDFLYFCTSDKEIHQNKIRLLQKALLAVQEDGHQKHLNILLGEEYYSSSEWELAAESYAKALSGWKNVDDMIKLKTVDCYRKLKRQRDALGLALTLKGCEPFDINDLEDLSFTEILFDAKVLFTDTNTVQGNVTDTVVYDSLVGQIILKPITSFSLLKDLFQNVDSVSLDIRKVVVHLENSKNRAVTEHVVAHDATVPNSVLQYDTSANLLIYTGEVQHAFKVIEFTQEIKKSGIYSIKEIEIQSSINLMNKEKQVSIAVAQNITEFPYSSYSWYYKLIGEQLEKIPLKLPTHSQIEANQVKVLPVKPNISLQMTSDQKSIILGEKALLSFDIKATNDRKLNYKKVSLSPRIKVVSDQTGDTSFFDPKVSWEGLKDDESLVLDDLDNPEIKSVNLSLTIQSSSLHAAEQLRNSANMFLVALEFKTLVVEDDSDPDDNELVVYDTASYTIAIVNSPFKTKFSISPRYRESVDSVNDMPNPFILHDQNNHSLPVVTRVWQGNLFLSAYDTLDVDNIEFVIKSKNPEIVVDFLPTDNYQQQLFTTKSKNGVSHRNVSMVASAKISWKRPGSNDSNVFSTDEWEILLPLSDPRVLIKVTKLDEEKIAKLKYIIENPTPRIFTFSSKLVDESDRFTWNFGDSRNINSLVQPKFPVLPFSRLELEYYAKFNSVDDTVQLPQLKVVDLQYKVNLPTLPAAGDITSREGVLIWNLEQKVSEITTKS